MCCHCPWILKEAEEIKLKTIHSVSGLQTSRARSVLVSARSEQAESERGFLALGRDEPSPRIDLISENEPRRARVTPSRDREWRRAAQLISARLRVLGVAQGLRHCKNTAF
jgi:hypothetical protein